MRFRYNLLEEIMASGDEQSQARIRAEMLQRAVSYLVGQGTPRNEAQALAEQALRTPSHFPIPTLEELERDE
jgi:hypothetical protein